ncbi:hypothetical protein ANRL3_01270 [Anaerolineae bacterium]|nr:hypothetical protein ANRL3_01270 [Anaerolineae bacterium]
MPIVRCNNPECFNKDCIVIADVNILSVATEAFALKILDEQHGNVEDFLCKLEVFFDGLRRCTIDGTLHMTEVVWQEYQPERNKILQNYRGNKPNFDQLKARVGVFFTKWDVANEVVADVRQLPPVPKTATATPGSNDLSLLALALNKASENFPVTIATMDEALIGVVQRVGVLGKIKWNQTSFKSSIIRGQTGLICTEGSHRCCHIATDDFTVFQNHALAHDMDRMDNIPDPGKKQAKIRDHIACIKAMMKSAEAKAQRRATLQGTGS